MSAQLLEKQNSLLTDLQDHLERYCNVLPVFGFNSSKFDSEIAQIFLLLLLVNERRIEPKVIKKANQFAPLKSGDVQLLDILNFLGGTTSFDSFLKVYKISVTKSFFHLNGSMVKESSTKLNFVLTKPSLANCALVILLKKTIRTFKV